MGKPPMTSFKRNFILRNYKQMSVQAMADRLKISYNRVYSVLYNRGLLDVVPHTPLDLDNPPCSTILRMFTEGWWFEDIVESTGESEAFCERTIRTVFHTRKLHRRRTDLEAEEPDSYLCPPDKTID